MVRRLIASKSSMAKRSAQIYSTSEWNDLSASSHDGIRARPLLTTQAVSKCGPSTPEGSRWAAWTCSAINQSVCEPG